MNFPGKIFVLILLVKLPATQLAMAQQAWKFSNRLQLGAVHDNNIFESVQNAEGAMVSSAIFQTQGRRKFDKILFKYSLSNGIQFYPNHREEHKITQIVETETMWRVRPKVLLSGIAGGTFKFFLNAPFDFIHSHSALRLLLNLTGQLVANVQIEGTQLEYAATSQFDFFNRNISISLQRRLGNRLLLASGISQSAARFQRQAFEESEPGIFLEKGETQRDGQRSVFVRCTTGRKYLFRLTGEYIENSSNSIGYAYSSWRFAGIGAMRFTDLWLLRMAVILQDKRYNEVIHPPNLLEFDLERSETNSAVFDLSYDFNTDLSALLRLSFYKNESGLRGRYFSKNLLFLGLEYRF